MAKDFFVSLIVRVTGDYPKSEAVELVEDACRKIPGAEVVEAKVEAEVDLKDLAETPEEAFEFIEVDDLTRH